ncbi:MAG: hypothetical protein RXR44_01145 [Vulcanisaeta sp.]
MVRYGFWDALFEALRNIAYLHAIHRLIIIDKLKKPPLTRHKTATPITTNTQHNSTYRKL